MIKLGVVGAGYWGPNLIRNFLRIDPHIVKTVCERHGGRQAFIRETYPKIKVCEEYAELLEDEEIKGIVIAVQPAYHYEMARAALEHGKHVFVEKPLALTTRECKELIHLAEKDKLVLMVGHIFEYNPAVRKVRECIQAGDLGDIYYLYSERTDLGTVKADVNAMWNIAPHDISIILYWLAEEPTSVSARGYCYLQEGIEDVVHLSMEFPSRAGAEVHVSWLSPRRIRTTTLVGSKNMVIYDELSPNGKVKIMKNLLCADGFDQKKDKYVKKRGEVITPELEDYEPLHAECSHFIDCIQKGLRPLTDGVDGLRVVRVLESAQESLRRGGSTVKIVH